MKRKQPPFRKLNPLAAAVLAFSGLLFSASAQSQEFVMQIPLSGLEPLQTPSNPAGYQASASPTELGFGAIKVGTSVARTVTFSNVGAEPLTLAPSYVMNAGFNVASTTCGATLAAGQSCSVSVRFTPVAETSYVATLHLPSDAEQGSLVVPLTGSGASSSGTFSPTGGTNFGSVYLGESSDLSFTFTNTGGTPLSGSRVTLSNSPAMYIAGSTCGYDGAEVTLSTGQSCEVSVRFYPDQAKVYSGVYLQHQADGISSTTYSLTGTGALPPTYTAELSSANLTFGDVEVGASGALSVILNNTGTGALTLQAPVTTGAGFSATTSCGDTLPAGDSCAAEVTFSPLVSGDVTGSLKFDSNAGEFLVGLAGRGLKAAATFTAPQGTSFGDVAQGSSGDLSFTLANTGNKPITGVYASAQGAGVSIVSSTCGLPGAVVTRPASSTCTVTVRFAPASLGALSGASVSVHSTELPVFTQTLSGNGLDASTYILTSSAAKIDYPDTDLNATVTRSLVLQNTGTGTLTLGTPTVSGAAFLPQGTTCTTTLAPGGSCSVSIDFKPTVQGPAAGSLTVTSNATAGNLSVPLNGKGVLSQGTLTPSTSTAFGSVGVGETKPLAFTYSNSGTRNLTGVFAAVTGTGLTLQGNTCGVTGSRISLAAGASCTYSVVYAPTVVGTLSSASTSVTSAEAPLQTQALTGTAVNKPTVNDNSVDFGTVLVGNNGTQVVTLTNNSGGTRTISVSTLTAPFGRTTTCGTSLANGSSCTISFTYTPSTATTINSSLTITTDVGNIAVSVTGKGQHPLVVEPSDIYANLNIPDNVSQFTNGSSAHFYPYPLFVSPAKGSQDEVYQNSSGPTGGATDFKTNYDTYADHYREFRVKNANSTAQPFTYSVAGAPYTIASTTCGSAGSASVSGNSTCTITVRFRPSSSVNGASSPGTFSLSVAQTGQAMSVNLRGSTYTVTGSANAIPRPTGGTYGPHVVTFTNSGPISMYVNGAAFKKLYGGSNSVFNITKDNCVNKTLAPGATCTVEWTWVWTGGGLDTNKHVVISLPVIPSVEKAYCSQTGNSTNYEYCTGPKGASNYLGYHTLSGMNVDYKVPFTN